MKALLAIDGSAESALALETAAGLAWPSGSRLVVLTVRPTDADLLGGPWVVGVPYVAIDDLGNRLDADGRALVESAAARLRRPGLEVETRVVAGRAATVIVESVRDGRIDLVIVGARGHGAIAQALLGSVSAEVVDQAHCAVLVARRETAGRVLIGTDGSDVATAAITFVGGSGLLRSAETRVIHAIDLHPTWWLGFTPGDGALAVDAYQTVLDEGRKHADDVTSVAAELLEGNGLHASRVVAEGPAASAILEEARRWEADLIVVGTRGQGLLKRLLLGSTARSVLHHADASVLIVPAASGVSLHQGGTSTERADAVPA